LIARGGGSQRRRSWSQHGGGGGDVSVAARRGKEGIERVAVLSGSLTRFQRVAMANQASSWASHGPSQLGADWASQPKQKGLAQVIQ
jgi:hypothetical protein